MTPEKKSSLINAGIKTLSLGGTAYNLLGLAGTGGSSFVYKVRPANDSEFYMIKEFYPHDLVEKRDEDGAVRFVDIERVAVNARMARARHEVETAKKLRDEKDNNHPLIIKLS